MKALKKIAALLMSVVMVIGITGCKRDRQENASKLLIDTAQTLKVWYTDDKYTSYLEFIAKQFKSVNEFLEVEVKHIETNDLPEYIYDETVHNSNVADVFLMSSKDIEKAYKLGLMAENDVHIKDYSDKNYPITAINEACFAGKMYGYPVTFNTGVMVYNKKYADSVQTFDELNSYISSYQVNEGNKEVTNIVAWDPYNLMLNYPFVGSYINIGGVSAEDSAKLDVESDSFKTAVKAYASLKEILGEKYAAKSYEEYLEDFKKGRLIYTIVESKDLAQINESGIDYGICGVPAVTSGFVNQAVSESTLCVVNNYTTNAALAKAFACAISYDYADCLEEYTGYISSRKDIIAKDKKEEYQKLINIFTESDMWAKYIGNNAKYEKINMIMSRTWKGDDVNTAYNILQSTGSQ